MPVSVSGERRALNSMQGAPRRFQASLPRAMHIAAVLLVQKTKNEIVNGSKSGRQYGDHQASAPGEYSAFLSGEHLKSIDYDVQGSRQFEFGAGAPHSIFLELGTSKMEPREDLGQTVQSEDATVTRTLGQIPYKALIK